MLPRPSADWVLACGWWLTVFVEEENKVRDRGKECERDMLAYYPPSKACGGRCWCKRRRCSSAEGRGQRSTLKVGGGRCSEYDYVLRNSSFVVRVPMWRDSHMQAFRG